MSYVSDPISLVRSKVKALLKDKLPSGTELYEDRPEMGPTVPCIIMQVIAGITKESGMGEVKDAETKSHRVFVVVQFDAYHDTSTGKDALSNLLLNEIWKGRHALKAGGVEYEGFPRVPTDLPADQVGSRLFRSSCDCRFSVEMTAALS